MCLAYNAVSKPEVDAVMAEARAAPGIHECFRRSEFRPAEVDQLWARLTEGGEESHCGWLVDRFGLSCQIIPSMLPRLLGDPDREKAGRATKAMLKMQKIDIAALERAAAGDSGD